MSRNNPILLTDLDNTLYDWVDYFGPCFRAMVDELSSATKVDRDEIFRQFQRVYNRRQAPEYRWAIHELDILQPQGQKKVRELAWSGFLAFVRCRRNHLRLYPKVWSTLEQIRGLGWTVIAVSNAPVREALRRVRYLGLHEQLDALVAWEGAHNGDRKVAERSAPNCLPLQTFSSQSVKPSTDAYTRALERFAPGSRSRIWVVGDSVANDLVPARDIGAGTVWARYGSGYDEENFATVSRLSFWNPDKMRRTYDPTALEPDAVIDGFDAIIDVLEPESSSHSKVGGNANAMR